MPWSWPGRRRATASPGRSTISWRATTRVSEGSPSGPTCSRTAHPPSSWPAPSTTRTRRTTPSIVTRRRACTWSTRPTRSRAGRDLPSVSPAELRELLLTPEQAAQLDAPGSKDAAVLIPLYPRDDDLVAVFTERRHDLRRHGGEISFPGGRQDFPEEDLRTTALREAQEEIGLEPDDVEIVGVLPPVGTFVTNYKIHPFVGVIKPGHAWTPQPTEVDVILEMSIPQLRAGHEMRRLVRKGVPFKTPTYTVGGNLIWGATARIVEHLLERVAPLLH